MADRHKSRAPSLQRRTDGQTDRQKDRRRDRPTDSVHTTKEARFTLPPQFLISLHGYLVHFPYSAHLAGGIPPAISNKSLPAVFSSALSANNQRQNKGDTTETSDVRRFLVKKMIVSQERPRQPRGIKETYAYSYSWISTG